MSEVALLASCSGLTAKAQLMSVCKGQPLCMLVIHIALCIVTTNHCMHNVEPPILTMQQLMSKLHRRVLQLS